MSTELLVNYSGNSESLTLHRLSIGEMGEALTQLVKALRRTASGLVRSAGMDETYGARGGKLSEAAQELDLQISSIGDGSVSLNLQCVQRVGVQRVPDMWIVDATLERLLDDLEAESKGKPRNASVRKYLQAVPDFVTQQTYTAVTDGKPFKSVTIGEITVAEIPTDVPRVLRFPCRLAKVNLEPGTEAVSIRVLETGRVLRLGASANLVEKALELRHEEIRATVLIDKKSRLLRVDPLAATFTMNRSERIGVLTSRWFGALAELAK